MSKTKTSPSPSLKSASKKSPKGTGKGKGKGKRIEPTTVLVNGLEYFMDAGETQREAIKRVKAGGSNSKLTPRGELKVLRDRAKRPFWIQHERGGRVLLTPPVASERAARGLYTVATKAKKTTGVYLFQHGLGGTICVDSYAPPPPACPSPGV